MNPTLSSPAATDAETFNLEALREFHRRMAAIIDAVQTRLWDEGAHELVGYATDYNFGQRRGFQTLVLKNNRRSAYVRLDWNTVMGDGVAERASVEEAIRSAIVELR